ncbi:MAG TPA: HNH endonuclease signature motif containing protein [Steroidobacteraceae bacterium]
MEDLIASLRRKAEQSAAVADFCQFFMHRSGMTSSPTWTKIDHYFYHAFNCFNRYDLTATAWLENPLWTLLQVEGTLIGKTRSASVFRHLVIPHPRYALPDVRTKYVTMILTVTHLQLCFGINIFVHLVHPRFFRDLDQEAIFQSGFVPGSRVALWGGWYRTGRLERIEELSGSKFDLHMRALREQLCGCEQSTYTLCYFDEHFENRRLAETRPSAWRDLRSFLWDLNGPRPECHICRSPIISRRDFHLDHTIPLVPDHIGTPRGNNTLANLLPAHSRCNRRKRNVSFEAPNLWNPVSGEIHQAQSRMLSLDFSPHWLGSIVRYSKNANIVRQNRAFDVS